MTNLFYTYDRFYIINLEFNNKEVYILKKEKQLDDNILEIVLGSILISLNSFSSGMMIEKIFVLAGFIILIVGIIRSIIKYKEKKGLFIFLIINCYIRW